MAKLKLHRSLNFCGSLLLIASGMIGCAEPTSFDLPGAGGPTKSSTDLDSDFEEYYDSNSPTGSTQPQNQQQQQQTQTPQTQSPLPQAPQTQSPLPQAPQTEPTQPATPLPAPQTSVAVKKIYRLEHPGGDSIISPSADEGTGIGFVVKASWLIYAEAAPDRVPLFRCRTETNHFASTDPNCEGRIVQFVVGYVNNAPVLGTIPLYRHHNGIFHLINHSAVAPAGWRTEGILGYTPRARN